MHSINDSASKTGVGLCAGSLFYGEFWHRGMIPRRILAQVISPRSMTQSHFHVELLPRVKIPRWIVIPGNHIELWQVIVIVDMCHDLTLNWTRLMFLLSVELWLWRCQNSAAIRRVIIQQKSMAYWPGSVFIEGVQILSYTGTFKNPTKGDFILY